MYCRGLTIHGDTHAVADLDGDGAADVAIAQSLGGGEPYGCGAPVGSDGVSVFFPRDGRRQDIAIDAPRTVTAADASGDGVADLEVTTGDGTVRHLIGGAGLLRFAPTAVDDTATTRRRVRVRIPVLANDAATSRATVAIVRGPARGSVAVNADRTITYSPTGRTGRYQFRYRVHDDGLSATAAVTVTVTA